MTDQVPRDRGILVKLLISWGAPHPRPQGGKGGASKK